MSVSPHALKSGAPIMMLMDPAPFPRFSRLLEACADVVVHTGGRYTQELFQRLQHGDVPHVNAYSRALPVVTEYSCQIADERVAMTLLPEFRIAEKMVLREAVFNAMVATCRSLELWPAGADLRPDDTTFQDMSEPLDIIAQRLYNFVKLRRQAGEEECNQRRMIAASFIVEFGREHGFQPDEPDALAEKMLFDFLAQVKAWGEKHGRQDVEPCLEGVPPRLRERGRIWWNDNWYGVAVGTGVVIPAALSKVLAVTAVIHPLAMAAGGVACVLLATRADLLGESIAKSNNEFK